jgi:GTP-sensing pleiotropic transcriptional regulator CodY
MSNLYDKDEGYISEEDVEDSVNDEEEDDDDDESEQDESFLQSLTQEVIDSNIDIVNKYVPDPNTPAEFNQNEITKKFMVEKVRKRLLESYESQLQWSEDPELLSMVKQCKKELAKDDNLSALTAMKRIIKNEAKIGELVEAAIEEQVEDDDDDDDDDEEEENDQ